MESSQVPRMVPLIHPVKIIDPVYSKSKKKVLNRKIVPHF